MEETLPYFEKEQMQPLIDFMKKYMDLLPEEVLRNAIKKIVDNFKVSLDAAADNAEKHAYLYALYVNNAAAMGSTLFEYRVLTDEAQKEYYALPGRAEAEEAIAPYRDANQAEVNSINERRQARDEHMRGLEVFKGIALGDSPEDAKAKVEERQQQLAQAMGGQA